VRVKERPSPSFFNCGQRGSDAVLRRFLLRGLVVLCGLAFVPAAFAHHPVISGSFSCDGVVSFTATAWSTTSGLPGSRTNSDIRVYYTS